MPKIPDKKNPGGEDSVLSNKEHLFVFLTAIIKKNGGSITLKMKDIEAVQKTDLVTCKFNEKTGEVIFNLSDMSDTTLYSTDPNARQDN